MAIDTGALYYLVDPFVQWENVNGKPIVGGHVEVYEAGTDNKVITYQNWDGTRHPFKIPLGSDGRACILVDPGYSYDAYVYDSFNNLVCSRLNIIPLSDGDIHIEGMGQVYHDETLSGKGTPNSPLTVISGGKVYGGIYPIDVNNELDMISADNVPLGVQEPLYFVQDDDEGLVIGISGGTVPEGTMNESAFGYENGQITSYNGSAFSAGNSYEAGSYVDIDGNTINVTGLQPAGNYQTAGDYVVHDELSSYATQEWVENQSYMKEYMESAFYPSTSNPSGYLTEHQDLSDYAKTEDLTAYQEKGNYYSASNPSGFINSDAISSMATTGLVASVSADITAMIPDTSDMATQTWVNEQGYLTAHQDISNKLDTTAFSTVSGDFLTAIPSEYVTENTLQSGLSSKLDSTAFSTVSGNFLTAHQSLDGLMSASLLEQSGGLITGYNGTAFAGQGGGVTGDFELSAGSGISIVDYPLEQKTVISVTAQGGNPEVEQTVIDNSATWDSVTSKADVTAIPSLEGYATENWVTSQGYLTGVDLTPYQTTAGMTAYQVAGDYYSASNPSGFLTAHQSLEGYLQDSDLTIVDNKITEISGVPLSAGDEFPQSATEAIETVTANSADWNGTTETVSSNSGVWGGSALPVSAGQGVKISLQNDTLVFSNDETVLYSGSGTTAVNLAEPVTNFDSIKIVAFPQEEGSARCQYFEFPSINTAYDFTLHRYNQEGTAIVKYFTRYTITDTNFVLDHAQHWWCLTGNITAGTWGGPGSNPIVPIKIVGVNRTAGE